MSIVQGHSLIHKFYENLLHYEKNLTPLHLAVWDGRTESVKKMAEKYNPLPMERNKKGICIGTLTPIHLAALKGHTDMIKFLTPLIPGDPNLPLNGEKLTPIMCATKRGHLNFIKTLAPLSANPMAPNYHGRTPMHCAASLGI